MSDKVLTSFKILKDQQILLKDISKELGVPVSFLIRQAIELFLKKYKQSNSKDILWKKICRFLKIQNLDK